MGSGSRGILGGGNDVGCGMAESETRIEQNPRWVRGLVEGRSVVESRNVKLVRTHPVYPSWFLPIGDVKDASLSTSTIDDLVDHVCVDGDAVDQWFEEDIEVDGEALEMPDTPFG